MQVNSVHVLVGETLGAESTNQTDPRFKHGQGAEDLLGQHLGFFPGLALHDVPQVEGLRFESGEYFRNCSRVQVSDRQINPAFLLIVLDSVLHAERKLPQPLNDIGATLDLTKLAKVCGVEKAQIALRLINRLYTFLILREARLHRGQLVKHLCGLVLPCGNVLETINMSPESVNLPVEVLNILL